MPDDYPLVSTSFLTWFQIGSVNVEGPAHVDPLSAIMLLGITFIGTWIVIFSIGYMHDDPGYSRYFSIVSLFLFSMTLLVLADNFLLLFAGWEGVGLCSYLLIGYWYVKPIRGRSCAESVSGHSAWRRRLDPGHFLLWSIASTISTSTRSSAVPFIGRRKVTEHAGGRLPAVFLRSVGKSAQFPLYVWLPDAMEGPTPVSALIHAATMVTAGVYLLAGAHAAVCAVPRRAIMVACIGALTALIGGVYRHDAK